MTFIVVLICVNCDELVLGCVAFINNFFCGPSYCVVFADLKLIPYHMLFYPNYTHKHTQIFYFIYLEKKICYKLISIA